MIQPDGSDRFPVGSTQVGVMYAANDRPGSAASGLSHIAFVLDGNNRDVVFAPSQAAATDEMRGLRWLMVRPGEDPAQILPRGIHWVAAEAMDRAGNQVGGGDPKANVAFSVGEDRVSDWLVWDRFFTPQGTGAPDWLSRSWLPVADGQLRPVPGLKLGRGEWRRIRSGCYLDGHADAPRYFTAVTDTWPRMAYLAARVQTAHERAVTMNIGCDDFVQVWVNGVAVFTEDATKAGHGSFDPARYNTFPVTFTRGSNTLLVKLLDTGGGCGVHAWFTDATGNPVPLGRATDAAEVVLAN